MAREIHYSFWIRSVQLCLSLKNRDKVACCLILTMIFVSADSWTDICNDHVLSGCQGRHLLCIKIIFRVHQPPLHKTKERTLHPVVIFFLCKINCIILYGKIVDHPSFVTPLKRYHRGTQTCSDKNKFFSLKWQENKERSGSLLHRLWFSSRRSLISAGC